MKKRRVVDADTLALFINSFIDRRCLCLNTLLHYICLSCKSTDSNRPDSLLCISVRYTKLYVSITPELLPPQTPLS